MGTASRPGVASQHSRSLKSYFIALVKMSSFARFSVLALACLVPALASPVQVTLQSQLPAEPIEDPATWAWGRHPDDGLDYAAKNGFTVELCLANPDLIATAKCKLPLEACLANPEYIALLGCLDAIGPDFEPSLFQCQDNKEILCRMKLCEKHKFIVKC